MPPFVYRRIYEGLAGLALTLLYLLCRGLWWLLTGE
jgi:hypothetical protein